MKSISLLLLLCFVVAVSVAAPARPVISPTFHAYVRVMLREGTKSYSGGGMLAVDMKGNRAREDYRLEDDAHREQYITIHVLERNDKGAQYLIEENKCTKTAVKGQIENPWDFVAKTTYVGSGQSGRDKFDEWQYEEGNSTTRLAVLSNDPSVPLFLTSRTVFSSQDVTQTDTIFDSFDPKTPEDWVFYIPKECENVSVASGGDVNAVVYFANNNWNCANVACSSRVPAGTGQPGYQCAEFTARSLAAGGYIPGLSSTAAQSAYGNYKGDNLNLVTGLHTALGKLGFKSVGAVQAAYALFGDGGEGAWSHACIGIGSGVNDCHNNARQGITTTGVMYKGVNAILAP